MSFPALASPDQATRLPLQISSETAPAGGWAQFKVSLAAPAQVASGSVSMDFDPSVFGGIAQVSVFSATGDQIGWANVNGQHLEVQFSSPSAGIGQLPELPLMAVTIPVLATAKAGMKIAVTADATVVPGPTGMPWADPEGNPYSVTVNAGAFTVSGTVSVESVTPGGGVLAAGTLLRVSGTGFDPSTTIAIDGVSISTSRFISSQEVDVTLGGATEMTGKHLRLSNAGGASIDYFSALPSAGSDPGPAFTAIAGFHPILPLTGYVSSQMKNALLSSSDTWGFAMLNPTASPVNVTFQGATDVAALYVQTATIPPGQLYFIDATRMLNNLGANGQLWITASAPIRFINYARASNIDVSTGRHSTTVSQPVPGSTPAPPLTVLLPASPPSVSWGWQIGTPLPGPQTVTLSGSFDFFAITTSVGSHWLTVAAAKGDTSSTLTLTADPANLAEGTYNASISITPIAPPSLAGSAVQSTVIKISLTVSNQPLISASTYNCCTFVEPVRNGPVPLSQILNVLTNGTPIAVRVSASTDSGGNWLSVTPLSGSAPLTLTVSAHPEGLGLDRGTYSGRITIDGPNNTVSVPVSLQVLQPAAAARMAAGAAASPPSVTFTAPSGQTTQPQSIAISPAGSRCTVQSGAPWLQYQPSSFALVANARDLPPGTFHGNLVFNCDAGTITVPAVFHVTATPLFPPIMSAIVSSASARSGPIAPGEIISILGTGLGPEPLGPYLDAAGKVLVSLGGTQVSINGVPAPLLYVSDTQLNVIVPYEAATAANAAVKVVSNGVAASIWQLPLAASAASVFTLGPGGSGQAVALNQDGSVNDPSRPASRGTIIQIYATGGGKTSPAESTGSVAQKADPIPLPVQVSIGGVDAAVQYAGSVPQSVSGLIQINVVVPQSVMSGPAVPVSIRIGDTVSQAGVTVAVY